MPDWHTGKWLHNGLCDLIQTEDGDLHRAPAPGYITELRRWQRIFRRVTVLDDNRLDQPVSLVDIREAAERLQPRPDRDWS